MFTKEQEKFFNEVILPGLVSMALHDNIPMDMNELTIHHFEMIEKAKRWYESLDEFNDVGTGQEDVRLNISNDGFEFEWLDMYKTYETEIEAKLK